MPARNGSPRRPKVLVGETYVHGGTGRLVRVLDAPPGGAAVVESLDAPAGERWRCHARQLLPAAPYAERCSHLATIPRRLLTRGERLASNGDRLGAAGAFASAALALETIAAELRGAAAQDETRGSDHPRRTR